MKQKVLIIGATSGIAHAVSRMYAKNGAKLHLVARNDQRLKALSEDLLAYGASAVTTESTDLCDSAQHGQIVANAQKSLDGIDVALMAHGILGTQELAETNWKEAHAIIDANYTSQVSLGLRIAEVMKMQKSGVIAVIGSVAGDRGRQSNFIYGSAKAGIHAFLSGLRNRMYPYGVHVLTIKPGFVSTPMTAAFKKGPLWAEPEGIAPAIVRAIETRKNVLYVPFFWKFIMLIIKSIPEFVFKKLKL
jgi:short-subunit dehydrogenase